jgi:hypothetical protein
MTSTALDGLDRGAAVERAGVEHRVEHREPVDHEQHRLRHPARQQLREDVPELVDVQEARHQIADLQERARLALGQLLAGDDGDDGGRLLDRGHRLRGAGDQVGQVELVLDGLRWSLSSSMTRMGTSGSDGAASARVRKVKSTRIAQVH